MENWKTNLSVFAAVAGQVVGRGLCKVVVEIKHFAGNGYILFAQNVEQREFIATRGASQQDDKFSGVKLRINASQGMHGHFVHAEGFVELARNSRQASILPFAGFWNHGECDDFTIRHSRVPGCAPAGAGGTGRRAFRTHSRHEPA